MNPETTISAIAKEAGSVPTTMATVTGIEFQEISNVIVDPNGDGSPMQQESSVKKDGSEGEGVSSSNKNKTALDISSSNTEVVGVVLGDENWPPLSASMEHSHKPSSLRPCNVALDSPVSSSNAADVNLPPSSPSTSSSDQNHVIGDVNPDSTQNLAKQACGENSLAKRVSNHPSSLPDVVIEGSNTNCVLPHVSSTNPGANSSINPNSISFDTRADPSTDGASTIPVASRGVNGDGIDRHRTLNSETRHRNHVNHPQQTNSYYKRGNSGLHVDSRAPYMPPPPPPFPWSVMPPLPVYTPIVHAPPSGYGPVNHAPLPFHGPLSVYQCPFYAAPHCLPSDFRPMTSCLPPQDPRVIEKLINQIHYYFSKDSLVKDTFTRARMDKHGWVPISLIAGFPKVAELTDNIPFILDTMKRYSTVVEIQGYKIRKRGDWDKWLLPPLLQSPSVPSSKPLEDHLCRH